MGVQFKPSEVIKADGGATSEMDKNNDVKKVDEKINAESDKNDDSSATNGKETASAPEYRFTNTEYVHTIVLKPTISKKMERTGTKRNCCQHFTAMIPGEYRICSYNNSECDV